jgi:hypothetical protein
VQAGNGDGGVSGEMGAIVGAVRLGGKTGALGEGEALGEDVLGEDVLGEPLEGGVLGEGGKTGALTGEGGDGPMDMLMLMDPLKMLSQ